MQETTNELEEYSRATFAAGCFWCTEAIFERVKGVAAVISGYSGGKKEKPTYDEVSSGRTGHAEAFEVYYNPEIVDYKTLLQVFFASHDPTQVNRQGPDVGSQYRSMIFYRNDTEKQLAEQYISNINESGKYEKPVATEVVPYTEFWKAEDYHQDYVKHNPLHPYVVHESIPRLKRTIEQVPDLFRHEEK